MKPLSSARAWMTSLLLLGAAAGGIAASSATARTAVRPNLIFFLTDDQRWDALSFAGNKILKTPNMDRIAREGMWFENMFVTNSLCAPSRSSFLTGLYSHSHGVIDNKQRQIDPAAPFMPDLLREAGYEVAFCGKSHVRGALRDREWDYYFGYRGQGRYHRPIIAEGTDGQDRPYEGYMDDVVTGKAVEWLKRKRTRPFALFLWFKAPHRSWQRARRHQDLYRNVTIPKPDTFDDDLKGYPGKPRAFAEANNKIGDFNDVRSLEFVKDYYASLKAVDENVGRVFDVLEKTGVLDDTAMIYSGDNGFFLGEWRLFDKRLMHEPSIRVPLMIRYPKMVKARSRTKKMALNIDIAPTMLDLAGVEPPREMQGRSLVPILKRQKVDWRKDWLYEYFEFPGPHSVRKNRGVRTDRHKLIHYFEEPQEWEMYDLRTDPGERNNLWNNPEYGQLQRRLIRRLAELRQETGDVER